MEFEFEDVKKDDFPGASTRERDVTNAKYTPVYEKIFSLTPDGDGFSVRVKDKTEKKLLQHAAHNVCAGHLLKRTLPKGQRVVTRTKRQENGSYLVYIKVTTREKVIFREFSK